MSLSGTEPAQRLFFALWPDDPVRLMLDQAGKELLGKRIKRVPPANLHITLAFAGSVMAPVRHCLETAADTIRAPVFDLTINHVGHWPKPRITWIGPTQVPAGLWSLVEALRTSFDECGLQRETRAYQPHITLARKMSKACSTTSIDPVPWSIRQFSLVESVTDPQGARYQVLKTWSLDG